MAWEPVFSAAELWSGDMRGAEVDGIDVVVVRHGDVVRAYEDRCVHLGEALSKGRLEGGVLTCRAHEWQYDATTGEGVNPRNACLTSFSAKIEGGLIWVDTAQRTEGRAPWKPTPISSR